LGLSLEPSGPPLYNLRTGANGKTVLAIASSPALRSARVKFLKQSCLAMLACALCAAAPAFAGTNTTTPAEKDLPRHTGFLDDIKAMHGAIELVFVGDSITDGWRSGGLSVWQKFFAPHKALNLGISGDATQHVLWRMQHGELEGYEARLFVVMIGTNNGDSAPDVADGIKAILGEIKSKQPQANLLLLGIFPRGQKADAGRDKNADVNKLIAKFDDGRVHFLDIGDKFLEADKSMSAEVMPDFLHPNLKGYEIWAHAIDDTVKALLKESNNAALAGPGPYKKLAALAEQIKGGAPLGPILKTLAKKKDSKDADEAAEAKLMYDALHNGGQDNLDAVLAYKDAKPVLAVTRLEKLAAQFAGDELGVKAKQAADALRKDPKVTKELDAEQMFKQIQTFEEALKPVAGVKNPKAPAFRKLNADGIATVIGGCQQLIQRFPGTAAAQKAEALMSDYK
jgi:lysophospholipase L1-like esterase